MNLFEFSIPFIAEKIVEIISDMLNKHEKVNV